MSRIRVWTKQNRKVLENLEKYGRHVATYEAIHNCEEAMTMINAYDWLVKAIPDQKSRPADADYPVWVSMQKETTMLPTEDSVILELEVDEDLITRLNVAKWGAVNNYAYIPSDKQDEESHKAEMSAYGISDTQAYMSRFYPELKHKIEQSWSRVFDDRIQLGGDLCYGLLWEIKREWIV